MRLGKDCLVLTTHFGKRDQCISVYYEFASTWDRKTRGAYLSQITFGLIQIPTRIWKRDKN